MKSAQAMLSVVDTITDDSNVVIHKCINLVSANRLHPYIWMLCTLNYYLLIPYCSFNNKSDMVAEYKNTKYMSVINICI